MDDARWDITETASALVHFAFHEDTTNEGLVAYSLLTAVVFLLYIDHAYRSYKLWNRERGYRALRGFFISVMLLVGMLALVLGAAAASFPDARDFAVFLGSIIRGMLLVGGILIFISWRKEGPPR